MKLTPTEQKIFDYFKSNQDKEFNVITASKETGIPLPTFRTYASNLKKKGLLVIHKKVVNSVVVSDIVTNTTDNTEEHESTSSANFGVNVSVNSFKRIVHSLIFGFVFEDDRLNDMKYKEKLKLYMEKTGISKETIATELGITTRTLYDFLQPKGRCPSKPIKKIIDIKLAGLYRLKTTSTPD